MNDIIVNTEMKLFTGDILALCALFSEAWKHKLVDCPEYLDFESSMSPKAMDGELRRCD